VSFPWAKGWKRPSLDPRLYPFIQRFAADGGHIPHDHPIWGQEIDFDYGMTEDVPTTVDASLYTDLEDDE
jgi:hypothetical protein